MKVPAGEDITEADDYHADAGRPAGERPALADRLSRLADAARNDGDGSVVRPAMIVGCPEEQPGPPLRSRSTQRSEDDPSGGVVVRPARDLAGGPAGRRAAPADYDAGRPARPTWSTCATSGRGWPWPSCWSRSTGDQVLGSVTYARFGTPFALVGRRRGRLRMLGVAEHRGRRTPRSCCRRPASSGPSATAAPPW